MDELLAAEDAAYGGWALRVHDRLWRILSLIDAHGGVDAQHGNRELTEDRRVTIKSVRDDAYKSAFLLNHGISLVLGYAGVWGSRVGIDVGDIVDLHDRWEQAQPETWIPPEP